MRDAPSRGDAADGIGGERFAELGGLGTRFRDAEDDEVTVARTGRRELREYAGRFSAGEVSGEPAAGDGHVREARPLRFLDRTHAGREARQAHREREHLDAFWRR